MGRDPSNATAAPVENGGYVWKVGGTAATFPEVDDIPDSEIYLQDDWGDNNLTDRDDSGTTTHNGVEGVYRPEWAVDGGNVAASNEQLELRTDGILRADINLNLDEEITWEFSDVSESTSDTSGQRVHLGLFAETTTVGDDLGIVHYEDSYLVQIGEADDRIRISRFDGNDFAVVVDSDYTDATGSNDQYEVTRSSAGEWELFVNGVSQGSDTDTTYTDPQILGFSERDDGEVDIHEFKVS